MFSSMLRWFVAVFRRSWKLMIVGAVLLTPVAIYISYFGTKITHNHTTWAEMGSAMSGIYGPIIAVLTFFVLIRQIQLQAQTNEHMFDQAYTQDARADVEFYLSKLADILESTSSNGIVLRKVLHNNFSYATKERLKEAELQGIAYMLEQDFPQVQACWSALNSVFGGLQAEPRFAIELHFVSAQQKAIAMLSYPICAALDNYLYCRTDGAITFPYLFTASLAEVRQ